jgi:hypothetical protein
MIELLLALGIGVALAGTGLVYTHLPWISAFELSAWLIFGGLSAGVPAGAIYHWQLYRALGRRGALDRRWWLHPTALHGRLLAAERGRVLGWCYLGAAGFVVTVAGCLLVGLGVLQQAR